MKKTQLAHNDASACGRFKHFDPNKATTPTSLTQNEFQNGVVNYLFFTVTPHKITRKTFTV